MMTHTFTRTHVTVEFADPHLVCTGCGRSVREFHDHERCGCGEPDLDRNECCGAYGVTSLCPSWGPVDGCQCAEILGDVDHPVVVA